MHRNKIDWTCAAVWTLVVLFCAAFYYVLAVVIPELLTKAWS